MEVSIIIVNYNTYALTHKCIASIYQHTSDISFEIILIDNASIECSPDKFKIAFPSIILVENKSNTGFAKGNNAGIAKASGNFILLLNSDTELTENSIFKCVAQFNQQPKPGIVTCKLVWPDGKIQPQCQRFPSVGLVLFELFRLHKFLSKKKRAQMMSGPFFDHQEDAWPDSVWGTFFLFEKKILAKLPENKLPDTFFMYCEDILWCYVFKKLGFPAFYFSGTSIIHQLESSSSVSTLPFKHENEYRFISDSRGAFYAKLLMLCRVMLYLTSRNAYSKEIRKLSFNLFLKGKGK